MTVNRRMRAAVLALVVAIAVLCPAGAGAIGAPLRLVALGDSLTAGLGLAPEKAFPARLEAALRKRGHDVSVINAGVSGDTSAGGLARLDWSLGDADGVIVELGANDALRGISPTQTRDNLDRLLAQLDERGVGVLLAGMLAPRNLGDEYAREFDAIFPDLAERYDVVFYPFFLDGVAMVRDLNGDDGMHPSGAGVEVIVERILPSVEALLARIESDQGAGD
jgi:acyl-CoA thioesterase-1